MEKNPPRFTWKKFLTSSQCAGLLEVTVGFHGGTSTLYKQDFFQTRWMYFNPLMVNKSLTVLKWQVYLLEIRNRTWCMYFQAFVYLPHSWIIIVTNEWNSCMKYSSFNTTCHRLMMIIRKKTTTYPRFVVNIMSGDGSRRQGINRHGIDPVYRKIMSNPGSTHEGLIDISVVICLLCFVLFSYFFYLFSASISYHEWDVDSLAECGLVLTYGIMDLCPHWFTLWHVT